MYVCVCVCMCICVCVCVCGSNPEFSLLDPFPISSLFFSGLAEGPGYFDLVFSKIFYTASLFESSLAVFAMVTGCELLFPRQN